MKGQIFISPEDINIIKREGGSKGFRTADGVEFVFRDKALTKLVDAYIGMATKPEQKPKVVAERKATPDTNNVAIHYVSKENNSPKGSNIKATPQHPRIKRVNLTRLGVNSEKALMGSYYQLKRQFEEDNPSYNVVKLEWIGPKQIVNNIKNK